eukprot:3632035-Amphidinium_carterae.1
MVGVKRRTRQHRGTHTHTPHDRQSGTRHRLALNCRYNWLKHIVMTRDVQCSILLPLPLVIDLDRLQFYGQSVGER